jgi:hypothetical protein
MSTTFEEMAQEISERLAGLDEKLRGVVTEQRIREMIGEQFKLLASDGEFVRKMRFGGNEPKLVGTKYARYGLSVADIEFLFDLQESLRGQRKVNGNGVYEGPSEELRNTFQAISKAVYISDEDIRRIDRSALDDLFPRIPVNSFFGQDRDLAKRGAFELTDAYQRAVRAMDTAESGYGSQLVGAEYVGELWEGARKDSRIFGLIDAFEMTAPTAYLPVEADLPEMLYVSENTSASASDYTTSKSGSNRVTVTAVKFVIHQMWSGEMEEDSIIPFVPFLRGQAQKSLAHYSDSVVLNGDTTNASTGNINLDDADPADTKHYLAFDGIRHVGIVDVTTNKVDHAGAAISLKPILNLRKLMLDTTYLMDWGHPTDPNDLVFVCDPASGDEVALIDEFRTVDQYGNGATILTGEVGKIGGHPLISSIAQPKTEADGKVSTTAGNNTLGQVVAFNRRGFKAGWRRRVKVESLRLPGRDQTQMVYSMRLGFGRFTPTGAAAGIESAAVLYDIGVA